MNKILQATLMLSLDYNKQLIVHPEDAPEMLRILQRSKVMRGDTYGDTILTPSKDKLNVRMIDLAFCDTSCPTTEVASE